MDILCWNVRGLNRQDRKDVVHQIVAATRCHIACLQESKLSSLDQQTAAYMGGFRLRSFVFKPATGVLGTRDGIVVLWNDDSITLTSCVMGEFHLSADIEVKECSTNF